MGAALSSNSAEISHEQGYVSALYRRLDEMREQSGRRLATLLRQTGGTPQAKTERDSGVALYTDQVAQYGAVEAGLCFGRLDFDEGEAAGEVAGEPAGEAPSADGRIAGEHPRYIGRIGIFDDGDDHRSLLVDWRAPAARPFYLATAASPDGVRRRRHIRTRRRTVVALDDEVLDLEAARESVHEGLTGEAALLSALSASRTGRMRDIVETIQAEQDHIIRAPLDGVLVVQGGPGTGKTAVALHRAAYLLYTHRRELSTRAVLIVGPNETFLRYISQVLPSLAETGVLLGTLGDLFPGVIARRAEPAEVAEIKGRPVMADVLAAAVRDRQRLPDEPLPITLETAAQGETLYLQPATVRAARERARRSDRPHNLARAIFDTEIVHALAAQLAETIGTDPYADDPLGGDDAPGEEILFDEADLAEIRRELRKEPEVLGTLDWLWPILTPQQLVAGLFASDKRLDAVAGLLTDSERAALRRDPAGGFAPADVPLLDEAAELLGEDEASKAALAERLRQARVAYAEGALEIARGSVSIDAEDEVENEILSATDIIGASELAERHEDGDRLTAAQRAAADRTWAFGHVIVDEAQELSPMAWRLLMRRCPSRSMTVVGDVAQTGDLAGTSSWDGIFAPYVADRWRLAELKVNYRTPAEIMAVAAEVLARIDPALEPPRSVRQTGVEPWTRVLDAAQLPKVVIDEAAEVGDGRLGVIVPAGRLAELGLSIAEAVPEVVLGAEPDLEKRVAVLTVRQAKGLEFDAVVVVDPDAIVAESPRGQNDLYVALTRATQRLGILT
ncbi:AAA family ATPase [Phytohabitans sp. ZYX-F-186]|uniref:AAA family ATPase n=1 Tax=Phytohabitans maris TaxID=3071409 RepID=A0ABU0ZG29_9ACTN|nr:ATP-binding domain-containing protein [Phytohabitans sp. ZYX-F-186]MDQ7905995.1 AAA family ATPase [Phytohabitans sp. ZYX-F-186]